jgi:hypothetical protein
MKNLRLTGKGVLSIFVIALIFSVQSCSKSKVRKNIAGTWQLSSTMLNGQDEAAAQGITYSGFYTFSEVSRKENKQGEGTCNYTITTAGGGNTNTETGVVPYMILDKGETMFFMDSEFSIDLTDNSLTLTTIDDPTFVLGMNFTR